MTDDLKRRTSGPDERLRDRLRKSGGVEALAKRFDETVASRMEILRARRKADFETTRGRSRVTNGTAFLLGVDGRSPWVRRCKDVIAAHLTDLGGVDNTSTGERSLIRRAAVITTELEQLEARFAQAGIADPGDLSLYFSGANNLRRLLETVGLRRRSRDITPSLAEYLDNESAKQPLVDATETDE